MGHLKRLFPKLVPGAARWNPCETGATSMSKRYVGVSSAKDAGEGVDGVVHLYQSCVLSLVSESNVQTSECSASNNVFVKSSKLVGTSDRMERLLGNELMPCLVMPFLSEPPKYSHPNESSSHRIF